MFIQRFCCLVLLLALYILAGCTAASPTNINLEIVNNNLPAQEDGIKISGLTTCSTSAESSITLNTEEPVIIIVHGCKGSAARFRSLAEVFAFNGQQAFCFNYNDRESLAKTAGRLNETLGNISTILKNNQIFVIGHSQGGLIARKAVSEDPNNVFPLEKDRVRLITIAVPFAGISAADHCASLTARILTLGLSVPLCKLISGDKWYEITHPSPFIQKPGKLATQVDKHLKIVTDESGSCRSFTSKGECAEDDFVFSLNEQYFYRIDESDKVENIEVVAGHSEIVGDIQVQPVKLIEILQSNGIMAQTDPRVQRDFEQLLTRLYR